MSQHFIRHKLLPSSVTCDESFVMDSLCYQWPSISILDILWHVSCHKWSGCCSQFPYSSMYVDSHPPQAKNPEILLVAGAKDVCTERSYSEHNGPPCSSPYLISHILFSFVQVWGLYSKPSSSEQAAAAPPASVAFPVSPCSYHDRREQQLLAPLKPDRRSVGSISVAHRTAELMRSFNIWLFSDLSS